MSVKIFDSSESAQWSDYLSRLPQNYQHVHFTPEYHKLLELNGDGQAFLFIFEKDNNFLYYPFMVKEINKIGEISFEKPYKDIRSVFGYTGPLFKTNKSNFQNKARTAFLDFCEQQNIIAELIRYNPLIQNHRFTENLSIQNVNVKEYVYVDLTQDINKVFNNYRDSIRNIINQAEKEEISFEITTDRDILIEFFNLYKSHMRKIGVDEYYLFSEQYFSALADFIQEQGYLIYSREGGKIKAGHIFLGQNNTIYNHHSARNVELDNSGFINKYLYHKAFEKQIQDGFSYCLLGGGATDKEDDGLLRFKKHFSHKTRPFVIGKRVINKKKYAEVIDIWQENYPELIDQFNNYVDKYRFC